MANQFYSTQTDVLAGGLVRAATINALDAAVDAAFDLLPARDTTTGGGNKGFSDPVLVGTPTHSKHAVPLGYLNGQLGATALGTSTTSNTVNLGSQTFTISESTRAWSTGMRLEAVSQDNPSTVMQGAVTSYTGNTLILNVDALLNQASTANDWLIYPVANLIAGTAGDLTFEGDATFNGGADFNGLVSLSPNVTNDNGDKIPLTNWDLRNGFLNPGFTVDNLSRGAAAYNSITGTLNSTGIETIDGWRAYGRSTGQFSVTRQNGGPGTHDYFCRLEVLTVGAVLTTSLGYYFAGTIYPANWDPATEYLVISFQMRSSLGTGNYTFTTFATSDDWYVASVAITGTDWQQVEIFIPPTSLSGSYTGALSFQFMMQSGANWQGATANAWHQTIASPYQPYVVTGNVEPMTSAGAQIDFAGFQAERQVHTAYEQLPTDVERLRVGRGGMVVDGRLSAGVTGQSAHGVAYRQSTNVITLVVPGEGRVGPGGTTVVHSSPTWATSSPSGNQIAAYNLATSAYVTLTGALSYTTASNSASALLVNITAGTSFNGTAGNPLVFQFGDAAYIYVRS